MRTVTFEEEKYPKIFVCGVNGVGKDAVIQAAQAKLPEIRTMGSSALRNYLRVDYEGIRAYPHDQALRALGEIVQAFIKVTYQHDLFLFNAHVLNLVRGEGKEVTGNWLALFDAMVLITAPSQAIFKRISADARDRALFPAKTNIKDRKTLLVQYVRDYEIRFDELAKQYGRPAFKIRNTGLVKTAGRELVGICKQLQSGAR